MSKIVGRPLSKARLVKIDRAIDHARAAIDLHEQRLAADKIMLATLSLVKQTGVISEDSAAIFAAFAASHSSADAEAAQAKADLARAWEQAQRQVLH